MARTQTKPIQIGYKPYVFAFLICAALIAVLIVHMFHSHQTHQQNLHSQPEKSQPKIKYDFYQKLSQSGQ